MSHTTTYSNKTSCLTLSYRKAKLEDCDLLFKWANDPITRGNAHNKEPIQYDNHIAWLIKKLASPTAWIFIVLDNGIPVALLRLDRRSADLAITYSVAPEHRSRGIGKQSVLMLPEIVKSENILCQRLTAEVYKSNIASNKIFINAGYQKTENDELNIYQLEMNMLPTILIATTKTWNIKHAKEMQSIFGNTKIHVITKKEELNLHLIDDINPKYIFFPHWSWIIPQDVYKKYCCIVFHMTDLPFGRGGSPLQNLIIRGINETRISALRVVEEVDAGDIFIKQPLSLHGTAEEIYIRASKIVFQKMMPYIICKNPKPYPQEGVVTNFVRRAPEMSELDNSTNLEECYDHIRMLDAEGYPKAFIRYGNLCLRFSRPTLTYNGIKADVIIEEVVLDE